MASMMEILEHCRLCLVKEQVNIPIFEELGDIRQIFLKITACLPVKVDREDNLPKKICDGCLYKLDLLYEFWNTATNAEKQLLSWLDAAGLESKAKIDEEIVVSPTEIVLKEEPITDLPNDISNDISIDISKEIKNDPPKDQNFMHQELPFEPVDFAYGTDTTYQDVPETITTATELVPSEGEPEPKRPRRAAVAAASAAAIAAAELANSESEEDVDDPADQAVTKTEDESEEEEEDEEEDENDEDPDMAEVEPAFVDVSQEANPDAQPGPSGIGKTGDAQSLTDEQLYDKYKAKFGLRSCVVLLGDLNSVDMSKYTMVKKKATPIVLELNHTNIISSVRYKYKCETCSLRFKDYSALEEHRKEHPEVEKEEEEESSPGSSKDDSSTTVSDVEEDETFSESSSSGGEEEQKPPKETSYQCKFCNRTFKYNYTYASHLKQHKHFACIKCPKILETKEALDEHLQDEHKICPCKLCPQMFYSERNLETHLKQKHYKDGIKCVVCSKEFTTVSELDLHSKTHTEKKEDENIVCDLCTKTFKNEKELEKHLSTHFSIVKILPKTKKTETWDDKSKPLTVKSVQSLSEHKCTLCNKIFLTKEHLDTHLTKHIHVHVPDSQLGARAPTTNPVLASMIVSRVANQSQVLTPAKTVTPTTPTASNVTAASAMIKTVSGAPMLQNKQIIISTAASNATTSNVSSTSITLNPNQHKLLLMNDKKYIIVSESSPISGNGVLKLVMTDPVKGNTVLQAIPALQPLNSMQPINNFLQPAINQTIVLPNPQNTSQISITNQTYNSGDLNRGTTNIVYTTPTGETSTQAKATKTYSGKSRKIVGKLISTSVAQPTGTVVTNAGAMFSHPGTVVTSEGTMAPSRLLLAPTAGTVGTSEGTMTPTRLLLPSAETTVPSIGTMAPTPMVLAQTVTTMSSSGDRHLQTESTSADPVNPEEDYKPKIFLKPLSQLLEKPDIPEDPKLLEQPASPDTDGSEKQEDNSSEKSEKIFQCKECQVVCKRLVKLIQHQSKYKCKICEYGCCKLKMLDVHYSEKHDYKNRCVSCDTQFPTLSELQHHKKSIHLCKKCNRCYFDLNKHQNNYRCTNCDFYACGAPGLDTHYKLVHRITTRCAPCNKIFYSNETFQQHKQEIHFCDKCCTYKMDLNVHKTFCKGGPKASSSQSTSNSLEVIELDSD